MIHRQTTRASKNRDLPHGQKGAPQGGGNWGDNETNWSFWWVLGKSKAEGSYTINAWMQIQTGFYEPSSATEKAKYWQQHSNAAWMRRRTATATGLMAPADRSASAKLQRKTGADNARRFFVNRHNYSINAGFADGHTEKVSLRGLWDQTGTAVSN